MNLWRNLIHQISARRFVAGGGADLGSSTGSSRAIRFVEQNSLKLLCGSFLLAVYGRIQAKAISVTIQKFVRCDNLTISDLTAAPHREFRFYFYEDECANSTSGKSILWHTFDFLEVEYAITMPHWSRESVFDSIRKSDKAMRRAMEEEGVTWIFINSKIAEFKRKTEYPSASEHDRSALQVYKEWHRIH